MKKLKDPLYPGANDNATHRSVPSSTAFDEMYFFVSFYFYHFCNFVESVHVPQGMHHSI